MTSRCHNSDIIFKSRHDKGRMNKKNERDEVGIGQKFVKRGKLYMDTELFYLKLKNSPK